MRWARFDQNGKPSYGVVEGDEIIPVRGSPFDSWERTATRLKLGDVKLLLPVVPPTFYAAGLNYAEHVREAAEKLDLKVELPTQADAGYRANNALIAHDENIVIPKDATELVQYEGELVAVIGRECKHLTRETALSAVLGYTIGNDVSERTWQKSDRTLWRAKNTDTFKPMGPWIETNVKLDDLVTRVRLNGKELIAFPTNHMVFGVVDFLVSMTRYLTL
jgi:2-keto-4-pentenoate hydratase/2-oxohepta-3-ene-1,7-dioic acid hydratase in catechol pathway